jgi:hypothetical protein
MDKESRILEEVRKTLQIMDGQKTLEANPFFYTRLKARLAGYRAAKVSGSVRIMAALKPAGLLLLLLMNLLTALYVVRSTRDENKATAENSSVKSEITKDYRFDQNCYIYNIKD